MANNKKRTSNLILTLVLIAILAILANIFIFRTIFINITPHDNENLRTAPLTEAELFSELQTENPLENYTPIQINSSELHFGDLALISNDNAYLFDGTPSIITKEPVASVYGSKTRDYYIIDATINLTPTVISQLNTMFADYKAFSGVADIMINSAHRTIEQQEALFASKGESVASKPGFSEHHSGLAFDLCIYSNGKSRTYADEGTYTWVPENCASYGFIRRYPDGKTAITGISFEPWHFRYVGVPHSNYIFENQLVLEEYLELVRHYTLTSEHLKINANGKDYEVYFVPATEGTTQVYCPKDKAYTISGNNIDGFIVTVDMTPQVTADESTTLE